MIEKVNSVACHIYIIESIYIYIYTSSYRVKRMKFFPSESQNWCKLHLTITRLSKQIDRRPATNILLRYLISHLYSFVGIKGAIYTLLRAASARDSEELFSFLSVKHIKQEARCCSQAPNRVLNGPIVANLNRFVQKMTREILHT